MPIITNAFTAYGYSYGTDANTVRKEAIEGMINMFFDKMHDILSKDFKRVDENILEFTMNNISYRYRESYAVPNEDNKYIVIEITNQNAGIGQGNDSNDRIVITMYLSDSIVKSSNTTFSNLAEYSVTLQGTSTFTNNDGVYKCNIAISGFMLNLYNDNISLYRMSNSSAKSNLILSIGKCIINDNDYIVYSYNSVSSHWILWDNNGVKLYTASKIIASHSGIDDTDLILTLPIYLTNSSDATSIIYKDLKIENTLQTTNNACSYGSTYKIDDVEYFALTNNILVKL